LIEGRIIIHYIDLFNHLNNKPTRLAMKYKVGDRIVYLEESTQTLMKSELPGKITRVNDDETYNLKLDDGRKIEAVDGTRITKWTQPINTIDEVDYVDDSSELTHQALIDLFAEVSIHKDLF